MFETIGKRIRAMYESKINIKLVTREIGELFHYFSENKIPENGKAFPTHYRKHQSCQLY